MYCTKDRLLSHTEAAYVLGYKTYRSINNLIEKKIIKTYQTHPKGRKQIRLSQIMKLAKPIKIP
ncbi:MAG: hypothetical protein CMI23_11795 [Opitutae bacterium]|nr:hypothetical protein [Opitutae bacterium]|tara:strand:- start:75 stop:266 length:192 start_codon:yes stop_codon:yes gene_type:complete